MKNKPGIGEEMLFDLMKDRHGVLLRIVDKLREQGYGALTPLEDAWLELCAATAALGTAAARWDLAAKKYAKLSNKEES